jgi:hypothetical protein
MKQIKKMKQVEGWDTETYPEWIHGKQCSCKPNGVCKPHNTKDCAECCKDRKEHKWKGRTFLLTHYDGNVREIFLIESKEDLLKAFLRPGNQSLHFFYNLRFDIESMLKWFGPGKFFKILSDSTEAIELTDGIFCKYVVNKCFILGEKTESGKMNNPMKCFDAAQFYDKQPLKKVAPIIGMEKVDEESVCNLSRYKRDLRYKINYDFYAMIDAEICQRLADRFYTNVNKIIPCHAFFSAASIAKQFVLGKRIDANHRLPHDVLQWALLTCSGARIETAKRGTFQAWKVDKVSAYPSKEIELPSVVHIEWKKVRNGDYHPDALYGFYCIDVKIYDRKFGLLPIKDQDPIAYPIGNLRNQFVTKPELEVLMKEGWKIKIHGGIEGFDEDPEYPFQCVKEIFDERVELKNRLSKLIKEQKSDIPEAVEADIRQLILKIIMNGLYGCFLQLTPNTQCIEWSDEIDIEDIIQSVVFDEEMISLCKIYAEGGKWKAGVMFQPVYGTDILAKVRCDLYNTVYDYGLEDNVLFFATDAIALDCPPTKIPKSKELGGWDVDLENRPLTILGSGVYYYTKEKDGKIIEIDVTRGFKKESHNILTCKDCKVGKCTAFSIKNIKEVVQEFKTKPKPIHAASAIRQKRFDDINLFREQTKKLNLNFDQKRIWHDKFHSANDLWNKQIDSSPIILP